MWQAWMRPWGVYVLVLTALGEVPLIDYDRISNSQGADAAILLQGMPTMSAPVLSNFMVSTRRVHRPIGTYNSPSSFTLSLLACMMNVDESFDEKLPLLDSLDRAQLLCRLLNSSAALH